MKDDFSQDEKNFSKMNQTENSSFVNDDSLDWAKQAYLQLKQKQKEEKELCQKEIEEKISQNILKPLKKPKKINIKEKRIAEVKEIKKEFRKLQLPN